MVTSHKTQVRRRCELKTCSQQAGERIKPTYHPIDRSDFKIPPAFSLSR